jgi:hypothetical protein
LRKIITGGLTAAVAVSIAIAGGAFAGNPDSNGAQRSGLSPRSGDPMSGQCIAGNGAGTNGFTIFNAPGKPGATIKFNGEVSLKRGAPDTLYDVMLSKDGGSCMLAGMIMTNGQGNGNSHLAQPGSGAGTYYVVLQTGGNEAFATGPVTVK